MSDFVQSSMFDFAKTIDRAFGGARASDDAVGLLPLPIADKHLTPRTHYLGTSPQEKFLV